MKRLYINPITRTISPKYRSQKAVYISKGDHNSVLLRFEIPKTVDRQDMSQATIQIHYANMDITDTTKVSKGMSDVIEVEANDEVVTFAWKIPKTATRYAGVLSIGVTFEKYETIDDNLEEVYSWSTAPYSETVVCDSYDNSAEVTEREHDYLVATCNAIVEASLKGNLKPLFEEVAEEVVKEAEGYRDWAKTYADESADSASMSESYAVGGTGEREGENTDNALHYSEQAKKYSETASTSATNAQTAESNAKGYRDEASGIKGEVAVLKRAVETAKSAVETAKSAVETAKSAVETAKSEVEVARNEAGENAMYSQTCRNDTEGFKNEAEGFKNEAENFMVQASEHSGNAWNYANECEAVYNKLLKALEYEVSGTGVVKLEDVNAEMDTARVECSSPVTMYGKNLTNFVGNWSGTFASNGRPYFIINVPCNVTLSVTRKDNGAGVNNAGVVNVYKSKTQDFAEREPVGEQIASGKVFPPLQIQYEEGYYYCVSTTATSTGFFTHIQTEVGSASSYEEYEEPKTLANLNDVKLYSPTATLIAESREASIKATYTKDIIKTIERLENAIANS